MENKLESLSDRELMVIVFDMNNAIQNKKMELQQMHEQLNIVNQEFEKRVNEEKSKNNASTNL